MTNMVTHTKRETHTDTLPPSHAPHGHIHKHTHTHTHEHAGANLSVCGGGGRGGEREGYRGGEGRERGKGEE